MQTRIRTITSATGEDILPAFYSDNYFSLMPGESKTVTVEFNPKYLKGGRPVFNKHPIKLFPGSAGVSPA